MFGARTYSDDLGTVSTESIIAQFVHELACFATPGCIVARVGAHSQMGFSMAVFVQIILRVVLVSSRRLVDEAAT